MSHFGSVATTSRREKLSGRENYRFHDNSRETYSPWCSMISRREGHKKFLKCAMRSDLARWSRRQRCIVETSVDCRGHLLNSAKKKKQKEKKKKRKTKKKKKKKRGIYTRRRCVVLGSHDCCNINVALNKPATSPEEDTLPPPRLNSRHRETIIWHSRILFCVAFWYGNNSLLFENLRDRFSRALWDLSTDRRLSTKLPWSAARIASNDQSYNAIEKELPSK